MKSSLLLTLIERFGNLLRNELRSNAVKLNIQPVQFDILLYLSRCNRYSDTPLAVAQYLGITKGTISQSIKLLEQRGFLEKLQDKKDKRIIHLALSPTARELLETVALSTDLTELVDKQPGSDKLAQGLQALLHAYQQESGQQGFGVCRDCRYNTTVDKGFVCGLTKEALQPYEIQLICREYLPSASLNRF